MRKQKLYHRQCRHHADLYPARMVPRTQPTGCEATMHTIALEGHPLDLVKALIRTVHACHIYPRVPARDAGMLCGYLRVLREPPLPAISERFLRFPRYLFELRALVTPRDGTSCVTDPSKGEVAWEPIVVELLAGRQSLGFSS